MHVLSRRDYLFCAVFLFFFPLLLYHYQNISGTGDITVLLRKYRSCTLFHSDFVLYLVIFSLFFFFFPSLFLFAAFRLPSPLFSYFYLWLSSIIQFSFFCAFYYNKRNILVLHCVCVFYFCILHYLNKMIYTFPLPKWINWIKTSWSTHINPNDGMTWRRQLNNTTSKSLTHARTHARSHACMHARTRTNHTTNLIFHFQCTTKRALIMTVWPSKQQIANINDNKWHEQKRERERAREKLQLNKNK